ncbi:hypothetical protein A2671_01180 [Candidatus Kaiserbacteria bacterium RIFCSPHIGHO2_01_FULL_49_13]|uniref:Uncharacterized protein n=1 Tax=Candidatus Kaiserbacteria bacterium RIFCSPHIGHO2_01_FULL_49_13 TaxID=1798477 RepID=A0A1F6CDD4_9BACT|nr:MAG: hypothetical protein A2671_01180 [Candidatus Kaiserbacteria bacterium RIFCSPHIGHO2_01_FULL_49_13]
MLRAIAEVFAPTALCGHTTRMEGEMEAFGESKRVRLAKDEHGRVRYCLGCLSHRAIRCAHCGKAIFVDDPITLYPAYAFETMSKTVYYDLNGIRQAIGCARASCVHNDRVSDVAGYWSPQTPGISTMYIAEEPLISDCEWRLAQEQDVVRKLAARQEKKYAQPWWRPARK